MLINIKKLKNIFYESISSYTKLQWFEILE